MSTHTYFSIQRLILDSRGGGLVRWEEVAHRTYEDEARQAFEYEKSLGRRRGDEGRVRLVRVTERTLKAAERTDNGWKSLRMD